ncbi:MAG TPA: peptide ABC transporter substrate-binding protein [Aliidongia sp.]|nr:peptide ABC transporter substrate-binding protein [Aliidongia sp.]
MLWRTALAALLLVSAASADAAKLLRRGLDSEVESLDPQKGIAIYDISVQQDLLEGLTVLDIDRQPIPGAATGWEVSADGLTYVFHLRPDGKWSNGDPVTAGDFVYALRREVDPATGAADPTAIRPILNAEEILAGTEKDITKLGVEATDPLTLTIHLKRRAIDLPLKLADRSALPLHRATIEKWGNDWPRPGHFVGNGAYTLEDWVPQSSITLAKNPLYRDAAQVRIDRVQFIVTDDQQAAEKRWEADELDVFDRPPIQDLAKLRASYPGELVSAPIDVHRFITINMSRAPLGTDLRIRQALSLALDRETLAGKVLPDGSLPAYSMVPPVIRGYEAQPVFFKDMSMAERLTLARKLMAEAGYGPDKPLKLTMVYPTQEDYRRELAAATVMWKEIGVELTLDNMQWQVFLSQVQQKNYDLGILGEINLGDDLESSFQNYQSSNATYNWPGYKSEAYDADFARGLVAATEAERLSAFEAAERQMMTDMPELPVTFQVSNVLVHKRVIGWHADTLFPLTRWLDVKDSNS